MKFRIDKLGVFLIVFWMVLLAALMPAHSSEKWHEADYVEHYCKGEIEHVLEDRTRIDCLTDKYAIEYDYGKKWAEALGQSLHYAAMTGKKAGIVLILDKEKEQRFLTRLKSAIKGYPKRNDKLKVKIWVVDKRY